MDTQEEIDTKKRLLMAGMVVFAKRGLEDATVREICERASANVAAISYHYGGKDMLYISVLHHYMEQQRQRNPPDSGVTQESPPEARLRAFVKSFLMQTVGDGDPVNEYLGKLILRELMVPSFYFEELFERQCRPVYELLLSILRQMLPEADDATINRCASSVIGQCILFNFGREAIPLLTPELALTTSNIDYVADFIVGFSTRGVMGLKPGQKHCDNRNDAPAPQVMPVG